MMGSDNNGSASLPMGSSSSAHAELEEGDEEEEEEEEKEKESTAVEMMATMRTNRKTKKKKKRQQESVCRSIVRILLPMPCLGMAGAGVLGDGNGNGGGGSRVTGTLFGQRQGNVQFAVQEHPRSEPVLLLELPILTSELVRDMASTCVRIALEAERKAAGQGGATAVLYEEPIWSVFCDGRQTPGFAVPRRPSPTHSHLLGLIQAVSMGAGVLPPPPLSSSKPMTKDTDNGSNDNEEVMYMRANFERVVASRDSEAFYMMNPDGSGSPELTIFLLRV